MKLLILASLTLTACTTLAPATGGFWEGAGNFALIALQNRGRDHQGDATELLNGQMAQQRSMMQQFNNNQQQFNNNVNTQLWQLHQLTRIGQ
jgi:hypothetical protein